MSSEKNDKIGEVPCPEWMIFALERNEWLAQSDPQLLEHCRQEFFVATGNGGQKRNRTNSAVRLTHQPSGLAVVDCSTRSQHRNREVALRKLRLEIAMKVRGEPVAEDCRIGIGNPAYPLLAAWLMDLLTSSGFDPRPVAEQTGQSRTGLLKLLGRDAQLWQYFNWCRGKSGLTPLHCP